MTAKTRSRAPLPPRKPGDPFTVEEAADKLRVSVQTIYAACRAGEIKAMRIGTRGKGVWRIPEPEMEAYIVRVTRPGGGESRRITLKHIGQSRRDAK